MLDVSKSRCVAFEFENLTGYGLLTRIQPKEPHKCLWKTNNGFSFTASRKRRLRLVITATLADLGLDIPQNADTPNCWHRERNNLDQTIVSAVLISRSLRRGKRGNFAWLVSCFKGEQSVYDGDVSISNQQKENNFLCKVYRIKLNEWDVDQWERNSINAERLSYKTCLWLNDYYERRKECPGLRISNGMLRILYTLLAIA